MRLCMHVISSSDHGFSNALMVVVLQEKSGTLCFLAYDYFDSLKRPKYYGLKVSMRWLSVSQDISYQIIRWEKKPQVYIVWLGNG